MSLDVYLENGAGERGDGMNQLAWIGKIVNVEAIAGADRILRADVVCGAGGKWSGVVGLDAEAGQKVVVFLQDAILPPDDRWSFMEKHKWRVRMARFKGVPSECLIVAVRCDETIGSDVTELFGVTKYVKTIPASMQGDAVGAFPPFIPRTDEDNFQTVEGWESLLLQPWYATEKADGTSCTAWNDENGMHVCSRNYELREFTTSGASNVYWRAARKYALERLPQGLAVQFEIVGPGIQGNPMGLAEIEARAFGLYSFKEHYRCGRAALLQVRDNLGVPLAKQIDAALDGRAMSADELRAMAAIKYGNGDHGEGIVIRALNSSWSFKVINLNYKD